MSKKTVLDYLGKQLLFFDGGMGTMLQGKGMEPGENTDIWNVTRAEDVMDVHRQYLEAGANLILANIFGANRLKLAGTGYSVEELVAAGVRNAQEVAAEFRTEDHPVFVALDLAPTGKLLKPLGDLSFDDAYELYKEIVLAGAPYADFVQIETMSDTLELKAAVLAAKENCDLPVFATVTFDQKGKLLTGGNVEAVVALLEGLGVDALGTNCGLGPIQLQPIVKRLLEVASVPVIVQPNAGLPRQEKGQTVYDIDADQFAEYMRAFAEAGAWLLGGCCGTTPEHIAKLVKACGGVVPAPLRQKEVTWVSSYTHGVRIGEEPIIIGERINPTGKARFKQALRDHDLDYVLQEGFAQEDKGAQILDINVGLPEIDEPAMILDVMREVQSVIDLPLQIDTSNVEAMEQALRYYNGKAMINSVNGKQESMEAVFPLVKKYGGVVVGLTLDEDGIPTTAEGRLAIAEKIVNTAAAYGIQKKDIVIDVLCLTISSDDQSAKTTLEALRLVKEKLGVATILGVSNISFGLPRRDLINATFYAMALEAGLDCGIINPNADMMMATYYAYKTLAGKDENCGQFIEQYAGTTAPTPGQTPGQMTGATTGLAGQAGAAPAQQTGTAGAAGGADKPAGTAPTASTDQTCDAAAGLTQAIRRGLKDQAGAMAAQLVQTMPALEIINTYLVPALDTVGKGFEAGTVFLPQLLMSAEAAKAAFEAVRSAMAAGGDASQTRKETIVIATVKGDIHDIGKNIVKVLLENYGYDVRDLGKDVAPQTIVDAVLADDVKLVGLSALMTTTVAGMEETIRLLRAQAPDCKVLVGGAVLTEQYAQMIDADCYAPDAMATVHYAETLFGH